MAVLAAYTLRQSLLAWLKAFKADIELGGLNPRSGVRAHSVNGQTAHSRQVAVERAAAAAVADAAQSQPGCDSTTMASQQQSGGMQEQACEGMVDAGAGREAQLHWQHSASFRETDPLVGSYPQSSLQDPAFSSNAFPSFGSIGPTAQQQSLLENPVSHTDGAFSPTHSSRAAPDSSLRCSSDGTANMSGALHPRRAPPPPSPLPSPFAIETPAELSGGDHRQADLAPSRESSASEAGSSERRRLTVRFAGAHSGAIKDRLHNHNNSGFTELATGRSGDNSSYFRSRSDTGGNAVLGGSRRGSRRSISWSKVLSRQERAVSVTLDALDVLNLPPLPLPIEALMGEDAASAQEAAVASVVSSGQPSSSHSVRRQLSEFRCAAIACVCSPVLTCGGAVWVPSLSPAAERYPEMAQRSVGKPFSEACMAGCLPTCFDELTHNGTRLLYLSVCVQNMLPACCVYLVQAIAQHE